MLRLVRESIASKISLFITILVMMTASLMGMVFYFGGVSVIVDKKLEREFEKIEISGNQVREIFQSKFSQITQDILFYSQLMATNRHEFISIVNSRASILAFDWLDDKGLPVSDTGSTVREWDNGFVIQSDLKFSLSLLKKGQILRGSIQLLRKKGVVVRPHTPVVSFFCPVFRGAKKVGTLGLTIDLSRLFFDLKQRVGESVDLYLFNKDGDFLYHPNPVRRFGFDLGSRYFVQDEFPVLKEENFLFDINRLKLSRLEIVEKERVLLYSQKFFLNKGKSQYIGVLMTTPRVKVLETLKGVRRQLFILLFLLLVFTAIVGWFFARYLMKNINDITEFAKRYSEGESDLQIDVNSNDEIGTLALNFQGMIRQVNERTKFLRESERNIYEARVQVEQSLVEKNRLLENIRTQKTELESVNKDKDELLAVVSHDLKNPLAVIEASMNVLMEDHNILNNETASDLVRRSKNNAQMALNLITDLLDLARMEGGVKLDFERFKVKDLIIEMIDSYDLKSREKNIRIDTMFENDFEIEADYGRVAQVISNILGNALKFTPDSGEITLRVKSVQGGQRVNGSWNYLYLEIQDSGPGIPVDKRDQIFNKFEQARSQDRKIGTGLGLAISKNICLLHRGDIWVESSEMQGAKFVVTLPRLIDSSLVTGDIEEQINYHLLVVDSDMGLLNSLYRLISKEGYQVIMVKGSEEVLKAIDIRVPDLILLNFDILKGNGADILDQLRANQKTASLPVFVVTEQMDREKVEIIGRAADDLFSIDISLNELNKKIHKILNPSKEKLLGSAVDRRAKTILVVDGEEYYRELISEKLISLRFNVIRAKSGVEALFLLKKYSVALIISDIRMPELDGLTFSKIVAENYGNVPIVLMSSNRVVLPDDLVEKLGVCELISKPLDLEDVERVVVKKLGLYREECLENGRKEWAKENLKVQRELKILMVEDSEDMQVLFKIFFKNEPCEITIVDDGKKGLEIFKNRCFDFVFMDVDMPVMKGDQAVVEMREYERQNALSPTPIIVMTAHNKKEDVDRLLGLGFDSFISKPLNKEKIFFELQKKAA